MKNFLLLVSLFLALSSCIPTRITPNIPDYKVTKGKKFKRNLPNRKMFIFHNPKSANEFYNFINTKFQLNDINVYDDIPFTLNKKQYFFSFYEVEIPDKSINLLPLAVDILFLSAELDPIMEEQYENRTGNWYIAIEVYSETEQDCLSEDSMSRAVLSEYLRLLKNEYLASATYNGSLFKN